MKRTVAGCFGCKKYDLFPADYQPIIVNIFGEWVALLFGRLEVPRSNLHPTDQLLCQRLYVVFLTLFPVTTFLFRH